MPHYWLMKAEPAEVHAGQRHGTVSEPPRGMEHGAVATDDDREIRLFGDLFVGRDGDVAAVERQNRCKVDEAEENVDCREQRENSGPARLLTELGTDVHDAKKRHRTIKV